MFTDFADATSFLYTGPNPIQRGLAIKQGSSEDEVYFFDYEDDRPRAVGSSLRRAVAELLQPHRT